MKTLPPMSGTVDCVVFVTVSMNIFEVTWPPMLPISALGHGTPLDWPGCGTH
jgi:hypothetical protein